MREEKRKVKLAPKVVFEDKTILVLDKPAGLVVEALQDWLKDYLKIKGRGVGGRAGMVHRLDKETSGLLVVAKNSQAFENLQKQFKERRVEKQYLALVHGKVRPQQGEITASISRSPFNRKKFGVFLGGRQAKTEYRVKKDYPPYTLLELTPLTGRTHQIRVHLKHLGYPIVGDAKYGGRKTARADRQWCPRQFLHASRLGFIHPQTGKKVEFSSKLPSDLRKALRR